MDIAEKADAADLIDLKAQRSADAEHAVDKVRAKFGKAAMVKGLVFDGEIEDDEEEESPKTLTDPRHGTSRPRDLGVPATCRRFACLTSSELILPSMTKSP
jgi:hypothetical protein